MEGNELSIVRLVLNASPVVQAVTTAMFGPL